jgi:type IV pilus assembly protein PilA
MRKNSKGFSLIELLIVVTIILIIAAIAIPKLLTVKQQANATAAVSNLRSIDNALTAYASQYSGVGYPTALANIGGTPGAVPSSAAAELVDNSLALATTAATAKQGYVFTYAAGAVGSCTTATPAACFTINADPMSTGVGYRHFFSDESDVIRYNDTAIATVSDLPIGQ